MHQRHLWTTYSCCVSSTPEGIGKRCRNVGEYLRHLRDKQWKDNETKLTDSQVDRVIWRSCSRCQFCFGIHAALAFLSSISFQTSFSLPSAMCCYHLGVICVFLASPRHVTCPSPSTTLLRSRSRVYFHHRRPLHPHH